MKSEADQARMVRVMAALLSLALLSVLCGITVQAQGTRRRGAQGSFDQLVQRAAAARDAGRMDEAVGLYQQAVRLRPGWAEGWWSLGTIFYETDRYAEGRDAFRRLTQLAPKGGPAWALLGLCEFQLRDYRQAIVHIQQGRALGLGDNRELVSVVLYHAVILLNRFEQFEMAYDTLQRLLPLREESLPLIAAFGITTLRLPYLPDEVPAEKRELMIKAGRAAYLAATSRFDEARREYEEMIALFGQTPGAHYARGVYLLRESADAAIEEFRRELEISPDHYNAMLQIAFEYLKRDQPQQGLAYAEKAVRIVPSLFAARNALGRTLLDLGQVERAIEELEIGVKLAPDSPEMHFALSRAYQRAGRSKDAARARAEFVRLNGLRQRQREGRTGDGQAANDTKTPQQQ